MEISTIKSANGDFQYVLFVGNNLLIMPGRITFPKKSAKNQVQAVSKSKLTFYWFNWFYS